MKFLISPVKEADSVQKEIASEHGLIAKSLFLVRVKDKAATGLIPEVGTILKQSLGNSNVVILWENEKPI